MTAQTPPPPTPSSASTGASTLSETLRVYAWTDPVVDALGHDARSSYVETFWLPQLGPTAGWMLRAFATRFDTEPDGFSVPVAELTRGLGIGQGRGSNGPLFRTIDRIARFGLVQRLGTERLSVRRKLPPLTQFQASRLSSRLRSAHSRWLAEQRSRQDHPGYGGHAARLARSLLDLGATHTEVIDQLERWQFRGDAAERALRVAIELGDGDVGDVSCIDLRSGREIVSRPAPDAA